MCEEPEWELALVLEEQLFYCPPGRRYMPAHFPRSSPAEKKIINVKTLGNSPITITVQAERGIA